MRRLPVMLPAIPDDRPFKCTQCGLCCRRMHLSALPHLDRGDGTCVNLVPGDYPGKFVCAIYENRPKECRLDATAPAHMPIEAWYRSNEEACVVLQAQPILDSEIRDISLLDRRPL